MSLEKNRWIAQGAEGRGRTPRRLFPEILRLASVGWKSSDLMKRGKIPEVVATDVERLERGCQVKKEGKQFKRFFGGYFHGFPKRQA